MTTSWTHVLSPPSDSYRGLWVALDNCLYDDSTGKPSEGDVVDADAELAQLCARMRQTRRCSCAILYCDEKMQLRSTKPV